VERRGLNKTWMRRSRLRYLLDEDQAAGVD